MTSREPDPRFLGTVVVVGDGKKTHAVAERIVEPDGHTTSVGVTVCGIDTRDMRCDMGPAGPSCEKCWRAIREWRRTGPERHWPNLYDVAW